MGYPLIGVIGLHQIGSRRATIHSGKDVFAAEFIKCARQHGVLYERRAFGDALKEDIARWLGISVEQINANKADFRLIMQGYGTDYCRKYLGANHWIDRLHLFIQDRTQASLFEPVSFVVPDVRLLNEVEYIKEQGGVVVRVTRISTADYSLDASALSHQTETESAELPFDVEVFNVGQLADFVQLAFETSDRLLMAYETGKLREFCAERKTLPGFSESYRSGYERKRETHGAFA